MDIIGAVLGIVIGVILIASVAIPVTQESVSSAHNAGVNGSAYTILGYLPLFLALGALVLVASFVSQKG